MYKRKTHDEYQLQANYGYGWDLLVCGASFKQIKQTLKEYKENEKAAFRIIKKRIKNA